MPSSSPSSAIVGTRIAPPRGSGKSILGGLLKCYTKRRWRTRATNKPGKHENRDDVRKNLNELHGNRPNALQPNLHGVGKSEKQACECCRQWLPFSEDERCQGHEAAPGGHVS